MSACEFEGHEALVAALRAGTLDAPDHLHRRVLAGGHAKRRRWADLSRTQARARASSRSRRRSRSERRSSMRRSPTRARGRRTAALSPVHWRPHADACPDRRERRDGCEGATGADGATGATGRPAREGATGLTGATGASPARRTTASSRPRASTYEGHRRPHTGPGTIVIPKNRLVHASAYLSVVVPNHGALTSATNKATAIVTHARRLRAERPVLRRRTVAAERVPRAPRPARQDAGGDREPQQARQARLPDRSRPRISSRRSEADEHDRQAAPRDRGLRAGARRAGRSPGSSGSTCSSSSRTRSTSSPGRGRRAATPSRPARRPDQAGAVDAASRDRLPRAAQAGPARPDARTTRSASSRSRRSSSSTSSSSRSRSSSSPRSSGGSRAAGGRGTRSGSSRARRLPAMLFDAE